MHKMLFGWTLAALVLVGGCAATNGYREFYTARPGATPDAIAASRAAPPTGSPQVAQVGQFDEGAQQAYARQGYDLIGHSSFSSGHNELDKDAVDVGVSVGADLVVILNPDYQESVTTSVPITTPTTTTSHTTGTATVYGSGGPATAYGNASTTTYGSKTTYVPMTVHRYEYAAFYFIKRYYSLGTNVHDLTDSERRELQSNRGVYVNWVVDGTPAYDADILPGDIIVGVNGQSTSNPDGFSALLSANRGRTVEITIFRRGELLSKRISLRE